MFDQVSTVNRQDYSVYLSDKWQPNDRINAQIGIRLDAADYRLPQPGIDPFTCTTQYLPATWTPPTTFNAADDWVCNAKATFSFPDNAVKPQVWQPRLGLSYKLGANTAVRITYNRAVQFVPIASVDFGEVDQGAYTARVVRRVLLRIIRLASLGVTTNCGQTGFSVRMPQLRRATVLDQPEFRRHPVSAGASDDVR